MISAKKTIKKEPTYKGIAIPKLLMWIIFLYGTWTFHMNEAEGVNVFTDGEENCYLNIHYPDGEQVSYCQQYHKAEYNNGLVDYSNEWITERRIQLTNKSP